jgi:hypothetical protein
MSFAVPLPPQKKLADQISYTHIKTMKMDVHEVELEWGWSGLFWLRIGTGYGIFEFRNTSCGFIICGEFLDWLQEGLCFMELVR